MLKANLKAARITFSTDGLKAVNEASVLFIAVGTPEGEDGSADLRYVLDVAKFIGKNMKDEKVIVLKSTVPVGTADKVHTMLCQETRTGFEIVNNPEFLKEGTAIQDFLKPDRVVIGCDSQKARD